MNILMVSPQFRPVVGGYERAAERLCKALASGGHTVMVLAERRQRDWPCVERDGAIEIRRWWCWYRPRFHTATSLIGLLWNLLRIGRRFDVWHIHQYGIHAALAVALGRLMQRPTILKLTSSSYGGIGEALRAGRLARVMTALHRCASAVAVPSQETLAEALAFGYPKARVHLLRNGVDTDRFCPVSDVDRRRARAKLGIENAPTVLAVGRLALEKNFGGLLNAWALASARLSEQWRFIVVGDGPVRLALSEHLTRLGLQDQVRLVGQQSNVEDWLSCADVFMQASHREGLSNTMLEAMSAGLPVVITAVSGAQECVGETGAGIVVPVGDTDALAEALLRLASDRAQRATCGAAGRRAIEKNYSIGQVACSHEALYRSLIDQRRRR
jgi:glycosyltransferase involved in cell wall biosynthesis